MKKFVLLVVLFFSMINQSTALATEEVISPQTLVNNQIEKLNIEELSTFWNEVITEYGGFLPESQKGTFKEFLSGEKNFSMSEWGTALLKYIFHEFIANGKLLSTLIFLTIFSMFLQTLQNAFDSSTVSKVAYSLVFMVLMVLALNSFQLVVSYTIDTIDTMIHFILALVPLLLALIASSGGLISASFFHPIIIFLMNTSGVFMQYVVLPLLFLSFILAIVSILSEHYKVSQLSNMLKNWSIGLMGAFLTIFLAVISVQGTAAAISDGIALKTAKFVAGNFIPVIGRLFTEATDTVISASVLLKNTVGIIGMGVLLVIIAFPAIKILMIAFIYKFAAAVLQPLGGGTIIKCLDTISKSIIYVFACLAIVSFMFFLTLTVIIAAGNLTMMVR